MAYGVRIDQSLDGEEVAVPTPIMERRNYDPTLAGSVDQMLTL
jgi:hypothetical protein